MRLTFDTEQPARDRSGCAVNLQPCSAKCAQEFSERSLLANRQPQIAKLTIDRRSRSIRHTCDAPAIEIEHRQRFQDIVQLAGREGNRDILAAFDGTQMFEVPNAVLVENHSFDRQAIEIAGSLSADRRNENRSKQPKPRKSSTHKVPPLTTLTCISDANAPIRVTSVLPYGITRFPLDVRRALADFATRGLHEALRFPPAADGRG